MPMDWVFGSGHHAQTPVSVVRTPRGETQVVELAWSWYPKHGLRPTLISDPAGAVADAGSQKAVPGNWHSTDESRRCFGCHSTSVPIENGQIDFQHLLPGVRCQRCHQGTRRHVVAANEGEDDLRIERWADLSPLESIRRCGECHRRDDEFSPEEIKPEATQLVRFSPVGLSQSACFVGQETVGRRLTCTTCHDPHRPAETDAEFYRQRCLNCHGPGPRTAVACTAQPLTANCLPCHLPKVQVSKYLTFTDHWIRVRPR